jgi:hypothetical protein
VWTRRAAAKEKSQLKSKAHAQAAADDAQYNVRAPPAAHARRSPSRFRTRAWRRQPPFTAAVFFSLPRAQDCLAWCAQNGRYVDAEFPPDKCARARAHASQALA